MKVVQEVLRRITGIKQQPTVIEPPEKSQGQRLAEAKQPFPWGLVTTDEAEVITRRISGTASVTSGGVILSPWQCLPEDRVAELVEASKGLGRASGGLSEFDATLWGE